VPQVFPFEKLILRFLIY